MILLAFRHDREHPSYVPSAWEQVDLAHARLHVSRLKSGIPSVHPLTGSELRALRPRLAIGTECSAVVLGVKVRQEPSSVSLCPP
jgi:hypothetical protein